ncbi:MAG: hypothetical protein QME66_05455 [Candidatus Eisenbacteria bacterium]|nr:hypothetical protein [Candidatus Eisenbacteria bacterium]
MARKEVWLTELGANTTTQEDEPGRIREEWDSTLGTRRFRYVQVHATSAAVANGTPMMMRNVAGTVVTTVIADASRNQPAGVGRGVIAAGSFGWIQIYGEHTAVITNGDDDIADGDNIIYSATAAQVDSVAAGTAPTFMRIGVAVAADVDAANTVDTFLTLG